jgi:uncharacterized membrane protein
MIFTFAAWHSLRNSATKKRAPIIASACSKTFTSTYILLSKLSRVTVISQPFFISQLLPTQLGFFTGREIKLEKKFLF